MPSLPEVPDFFLVRQSFPRPQVANIPRTVGAELGRIFTDVSSSSRGIHPGARIGITVGSRGISNIATIVRAAVDFLRARGAEPFIIPSMGSHGGATAQGQQALIEGYGVTEEAMGCPIDARMPTRVIGTTSDGMEVYMAESALAADGILLLNRVKPHTDYSGPIESGLTKICAIGLGKLEGADSYHSRIFDLGLGRALRTATEKILDTGKIIGALAILENAYHETAKIAAVPADSLFDDETRLLKEAYGLMGRLPIPELDLLMCDRMGKNISGTGNDTNIIGRSAYGYIPGVPWQEGMPSIRTIFVRTLSAESKGNAAGMGLVDFTTSRFMAQVNIDYTRLNAFTARCPGGARPPLDLPSDRAAIRTALSTCLARPQGARATYILDTLSLEEIYLSAALLSEAREHPDLEIVSDPKPLVFDDDGWLESPFQTGAASPSRSIT